MAQELQENLRVAQLTYGLAKLMAEQLKPNDLLKLVSKVISGAVRKTDYITRYGGEEFAVIVPNGEGELR
jgi:predicted oxidoreductase